MVERIRAELERPIYGHSLPLAVEASIGIAIFPDHGADAQVLIQRADVAMYDSKRDSAPFIFYAVIIQTTVSIINRLTPHVSIYFISAPFVIMGGLILTYFIIKSYLDQLMVGLSSWLTAG